MSEWKTTKLKEFVTLKRGYDLPHNKSREGDYPVITSTNIRGYHDEYKVDSPVVTVGRSGSIGKVQIVNKKAWPLNTTLYVTDSKGNNINFIYYFLQTMGLEQFNSGAGVPTLNRNHIGLLKIKIPNIRKQEKIANVLSTYDKLIENNNRRIEVLEQTAEEIYKEWFVRMRFPGYENAKFVKGIPEKWEVKKVIDLVERFRYGTLYKEENVEDEGKVIVIDQSEKEFLGYHNKTADHFADINNPFILFGDHSCKMLIMTKPFSLSENVIPFKSKDDIPELFLYYTVKDLIRTTEYKRHWSELTNKKVLIPDLSLQLQFKKLIKSKIKLIQIYKDENKNLKKQRDLLLPRLMNGTIDVK